MDHGFTDKELLQGNITFNGDQEEIMRLEPNGDIYIHGKLAENDKQIVNALKEFLNLK